jgi:hypothetical protein
MIDFSLNYQQNGGYNLLVYIKEKSHHYYFDFKFQVFSIPVGCKFLLN